MYSQVQPAMGTNRTAGPVTTLAGPPEKIVPIYGKRNIETDAAKSDLRLEQLTFTQRDGGQRTDRKDVGIQSDPRGDLSGSTGHWPGAARVQLHTGAQRDQCFVAR